MTPTETIERIYKKASADGFSSLNSNEQIFASLPQPTLRPISAVSPAISTTRPVTSFRDWQLHSMQSLAPRLSL